MADRQTLNVKPREETGKGPARQLRREDWIPGVMYGHGEDTDHVKVQRKELNTVLERINVDNTLVDVELDGRDGGVPVLIREIQRNPVRRDILHVDLFRIRADEKIRVLVPLELTGKPEGVRNSGGILQQNRHEIEVECLPDEIPEKFELDVTELEIGDSLHVSDLTTGDVRPLEEQDLTLCTVVPPTIIEVEEEEEDVDLEELEPEVIGEVDEEEAEELAEGEEPGEEADEDEDGETTYEIP
jgi:large subunit ribosomal protein L25